MDLLAQLKALDQLVVSGQLVKAVQDYFHPDFYYLDPGTGQQLGKVSKVAYTWDFVRQIQAVNAVVLNESLIGKDVSMSEFLFDFTQQNDEPMRVHEIIKRQWKDGLVLREWYFVSEGYPAEPTAQVAQNRLTLEHRKPLPLGATEQPSAASLICLQKGNLRGLQLCLDLRHSQANTLELTLHPPQAAPQTLPRAMNAMNIQQVYNLEVFPGLQATPILGEWKLEIRNTAGNDTGALNWWALEMSYFSTDDLTKIEGVGPKIAAILQESGIDTFGKLAAQNPAHLQNMLTEAGNRYKMHNPASWPEQAALAAGGEWEKLSELQQHLKGGR